MYLHLNSGFIPVAKFKKELGVLKAKQDASHEVVCAFQSSVGGKKVVSVV